MHPDVVKHIIRLEIPYQLYALVQQFNKGKIHLVVMRYINSHASFMTAEPLQDTLTFYTDN